MMKTKQNAGVIPILSAPSVDGSSDGMLSEAILIAAKRGLIEPHDHVVCLLAVKESLVVKILSIDGLASGKVSSKKGMQSSCGTAGRKHLCDCHSSLLFATCPLYILQRLKGGAQTCIAGMLMVPFRHFLLSQDRTMIWQVCRHLQINPTSTQSWKDRKQRWQSQILESKYQSKCLPSTCKGAVKVIQLDLFSHIAQCALTAQQYMAKTVYCTRNLVEEQDGLFIHRPLLFGKDLMSSRRALLACFEVNNVASAFSEGHILVRSAASIKFEGNRSLH